jgi:hypothetical protein
MEQPREVSILLAAQRSSQTSSLDTCTRGTWFDFALTVELHHDSLPRDAGGGGRRAVQ